MQSAKELVKGVLEGKVKPQAIAEECLKKISEEDKSLKAFLLVDKSYVNNEINELEKKIVAKEGPLPLAGLPIAIKDNIVTQNLRTTCGSKILENYIPPFDATVIKKLKNAGAIIVGKTNLDEFAMGSSSEYSAFQTTVNPHDHARTPGGSSSGSAVSVAAGLVYAALGSDTGGSVRQPASLCGIVGIKPTYGRISRYGLVAFASSLDQIGIFTKTVEDSALLLGILAGHDENDATSLTAPIPDFLADINKGVRGLKIGLPKEYFIEGVDPEVEKSVKNAAKLFESEGARLVDISLPHTEYAVPTYYIIAPAEASANLARYDGIRYGLSKRDGDSLSELYKKSRTLGFGPEVSLRIIIGTYVLSSGYYDAYYRKAQKVRTLIKNDFTTAFKQVDLILSPTAPTTAFKLGEKLDDPISMYLSDVFTISCNLAGLPGMSIPCGFDKNRLPIGMQLLGRPLDEAIIFRAGHHFEKTLGDKS